MDEVVVSAEQYERLCAPLSPEEVPQALRRLHLEQVAALGMETDRTPGAIHP